MIKKTETPPRGFDGHSGGAVEQGHYGSIFVLYQLVRRMSPGAAYRFLCNKSITANDEDKKAALTFLKRRLLWEADTWAD